MFRQYLILSDCQNNSVLLWQSTLGWSASFSCRPLSWMAAVLSCQSDLVRIREQAIRKTCCSHLVAFQKHFGLVSAAFPIHLLLLPRLFSTHFLYISILTATSKLPLLALLCERSFPASFEVRDVLGVWIANRLARRLPPLLVSVQNKARYRSAPPIEGVGSEKAGGSQSDVRGRW